MRSVAVRAHPLVFGVVVFLASESMLFAGLLAAWYDLRGASVAWPPPGIQTDVDRRDGRHGVAWLWAASRWVSRSSPRCNEAARRSPAGCSCSRSCFALGFVYVALRDWSQTNFGIDTDAYGTLFYVLTGTHLAHVLAGAVLLTALAIVSRASRLPSRSASRRRGGRLLLALRVRGVGRALGDDLSDPMRAALVAAIACAIGAVIAAALHATPALLGLLAALGCLAVAAAAALGAIALNAPRRSHRRSHDRGPSHAEPFPPPFDRPAQRARAAMGIRGGRLRRARHRAVHRPRAASRRGLERLGAPGSRLVDAGRTSRAG